jgi:hypothetical protein
MRIEQCMKAGEALMDRADFPQYSRSELAAAIAWPGPADSARLKAQWRTLYDSAPPRRIRGLLIGAVAYDRCSGLHRDRLA